MKKIILLFTFIIFCIKPSFAQSGEKDNWVNMSDFAPKSPEAQAFQKYGDYNVNLAKGLVNISVPLHTLEAGDYKLPIGLNYNPSGIRINEDATWVGLGWSLNAGAQITLDVRDTPDETVDATMPTSATVVSFLNNNPSWNLCDEYLSFLRNNSWIKDVYHFSSPTAQGKFIVGDSQGIDNIHVYPPEAFKVETSGGQHSRSFKITDPQGNIYFFTNTRETSKSIGVAHDTNYYTTAWYVDQIKTPSNNIIDFAYTNDGWHAKYNTNDQIAISKTENDCTRTTTNEALGASAPRNSSNATKTFKLSSITYKDFRILFVAQTGRLDLATPSLLDQARFPTENVVPSYLRFVKIQNKVGGTYTDVKGYELLYSYFDAGGTQLEYFRKRLKLESVIDIIDENIATTFTYSDVTLPTKNSRQSDAWGFYNGASNNLTLVPPQQVYLNGGIITIGSADRNVNTSNVKAGILTEIKYPTKGKTKFNYESNQYFGVDELNKSREIILNSNFVQGIGNPESTISEDYTVSQQIPYNITGTANAILNFDILYTGGGVLTINKYQYARVLIYSNDSGTLIYDTGIRKASYPSFNDAVTLTGSGYISIEACGQYMGVRNFQCKYINNDPTPKNVVGPGLRIASIENYTNNTTLATKKQYTYTVPGQGDKSSGKLVFDAVRKFDPETFRSFDKVTFCGGGDMGPVVPGVYWITNTTNVYNGQSPYFLMNEVYYTDVKEENIDYTNVAKNGYTTYNYDFAPSVNSQEGSINVEYDWLRGNLINKKVFRADDKVLTEEVNNYYDDNSKTAVVAGIKIFSRDNFISCPSSSSPQPNIIPYENMGYSHTIPWHYLKSKLTTETMYNPSTNTVSGTVVTSATYNYSNPVHMQLSSQVVTSSKGETLETKYFYPGDTDVASEPLASTLLTANRLLPLKMQTFSNSNKTAESKKLFKDWGNGLIQPEIIQTAKGIAALENRLKFIEMDNTNGNVLQQRQENGIDITYIWGYNGVYPIAKIENATYSQVKTALGLTDDAIKALTEAPSTIRTLLPNAFITTYTYKPTVGVSSITDPKGIITKFEYDSQGRLALVKDKDNNILSENQYNYRLF